MKRSNIFQIDSYFFCLIVEKYIKKYIIRSNQHNLNLNNRWSFNPIKSYYAVIINMS